MRSKFFGKKSNLVLDMVDDDDDDDDNIEQDGKTLS